MLFNIVYNQLNNKIIFVTLVILLILGQFFNALFPHKLFQINQLMLMFMFIIQILVIKKIKKEKEEIKKCIMEKNEPEVLSLFSLKVEKIPCTIIGEIISFLLVIFYIITMYTVGCLEITITGVYGGVLGGLVFYIGIQAYFHYISLLYFAYDLRHVQINDYSFYFPALTNWLRKLARELSRIEKWFLVLGLMYSVIYAINLPRNTIHIEHNIIIDFSSNILLITTWIGILIFFAIAFPVFTFLSRIFIRDIIYNCKCNSIDKIEAQLFILSNHSTEADFLLIERLISLAKTISESDEYPLKYSRTIFDNIYTVMVSLITLISPFLSIAQEIIFKG